VTILPGNTAETPETAAAAEARSPPVHDSANEKTLARAFPQDTEFLTRSEREKAMRAARFNSNAVR
jgi:hypothetical protein